ncbi:hypothetical protein [Dyadobacter bucti]
MKEKLRLLFAEHLMQQGKLKITLRNLNAVGALTDVPQDQILDEIKELDD